MGLDMYLNRVKRINGATIEEIRNAEEYLGWLLRPSKYANCSMKKWCGISKDDVNMKVVDNYREEYKTRYYAWDDKKKYGHLGFFDGVGYWRKANQIHAWFVDNVQDGIDDCREYEISKENLEKLLETCKTVKDNSKLVKGKIANGESYKNGKWKTNWEDGEYIEDPSIAMELLPTASGFFFGGTGYDQWYMQDIDYTIKTLTKVLKETDFDNEIILYSASW